MDILDNRNADFLNPFIKQIKRYKLNKKYQNIKDIFEISKT